MSHEKKKETREELPITILRGSRVANKQSSSRLFAGNCVPFVTNVSIARTKLILATTAAKCYNGYITTRIFHARSLDMRHRSKSRSAKMCVLAREITNFYS